MSEIIITTTDIQHATILIQIQNELARAESKHPNWPTCLFRMDSIINEEKGEVSRAINQYEMEGGSKQAIKDELIQTAAMCVRMLKEIDK
jgi:NTP pyrophosphatase (non-canonical NTP hydrolase)